jgi:hypothetical protein
VRGSPPEAFTKAASDRDSARWTSALRSQDKNFPFF